MNINTLALILLAFSLFGGSQNTKKRPSQNPQIGLGDFLNDDTKLAIDCVSKLSSNQCSQEDKTSAIFQIISNPAVMKMASNLFGGAKGCEQQNSETNSTAFSGSATSCEGQDPHVNSEGYRYETPSASSQDFFREIDNIADTEIKHKLYWFYDNWYTK